MNSTIPLKPLQPFKLDPMAIERIVKEPSIISGNDHDDGDASVADSSVYEHIEANQARNTSARPLSGATNKFVPFMGYGDDDAEDGYDQMGRKKKKGLMEPPELPVGIDELRDIMKRKNQLACVAPAGALDCWGCKNGLLVPISGPNSYPIPFEMIARFIKESLHFVSVAFLVDTVKKIYDKDIRPHTRNEFGHPEDWSSEEIKEHLFEHVTNPAFDVKTSLEDINLIYKAVLGSIITKPSDDSDDIEVNFKMLHALDKITDQKRKLYTMSTEKSSAFSLHVTPYSEFKYTSVNKTNRKI